MDINFFDDSDDKPALREDVRIRKLDIDVAPDKRRVALDFELTPFIERPSVNIRVTNSAGEKAGALTVIETLDTKFSVVVHLRDNQPTANYTVEATLYFVSIEDGTRQSVHTFIQSFSLNGSS